MVKFFCVANENELAWVFFAIKAELMPIRNGLLQLCYSFQEKKPSLFYVTCAGKGP